MSATKTVTVEDKVYRDAVLRQIDWEPEITSEDITVAVHDNIVSLGGSSTATWRRSQPRRPPNACTASKQLPMT